VFIQPPERLRVPHWHPRSHEFARFMGSRARAPTATPPGASELSADGVDGINGVDGEQGQAGVAGAAAEVRPRARGIRRRRRV